MHYYDILFSGALGGLLGTIVGTILTFYFQKHLLRQQLEAQEASRRELLAFTQSVADEFRKIATQISQSFSQIVSNTIPRDQINLRH